MELYAREDEVSRLEAGLAGLSLPDRLVLAWHLRQRDSARAMALCNEIETEAGGLPEAERSSIAARIWLIRGEIQLLFAEVDHAETSAMAANALYQASADPVGQGDANLLIANVWLSRGHSVLIEQALAVAYQHYLVADDERRADIAYAQLLGRRAFRAAGAIIGGLQERFGATPQRHESVLCWIAVAQATAAALTDNPGAAIKFDLEGYRSARETGQVRLAIVCAVNIAEGFATLGDLDAALEWAESALSLARETSWPGSVGVCLMQMGEVVRQLQRHDDARGLLHEALVVMESLSGSRNHEQVLASLGQLALDVGHFEEALGWFKQLEDGLAGHDEPDLTMKAWCGQASALSGLGRVDEAQVQAAQALDLARQKGNADAQIKALRVFAELYRDHALPIPPGVAGTTAELYFLGEAVRVAETISGYALPVDLLNQLATAHAHNGDFRAAYENSQAAQTARNRMRLEEAQQRALAIQIKHEMDQARAVAEHHKHLAATLQETNETLETIGQIGQEITASLNAGAVFEALHRHVDGLIDAQTFLIYMVDESAGALNMVFGVEDGQPYPRISINLESEVSLAAKCVREQREILIDGTTDVQARVSPGTLKTASMLFAPLQTRQRLLGAMSIQTQKIKAYGERELAIFRALCAYGAIALDNAGAYAAVEAARQQTARQEEELRVAAVAFESQEGMLITAADWTVLRVNRAFQTITGYTALEVIGELPEFLHSVRGQGQEMAEEACLRGAWQGEIWIRKRSGEVVPLGVAVTAVRSDAGKISHYVFTLVDITERKLAENEIRNLAFYDPLTNLPNRRLLMDRLRHALVKSARKSDGGGLLFVDLDNFKRLNDTRGHAVGDRLLEQVAQRLVECLREGDTVARLGGDEFVVLLEGLGNEVRELPGRIEMVAEKMLHSLNQPYMLEGVEHHTTPSIGACVFYGKDETAEELLKQADVAMYQAKAAGRNTIRFFNPTMQAEVSAQAELEADLRLALAHRQFALHYQPQVDTEGRVFGVEALLRWAHPIRGMVSPGDFIPLAEETGLILPIGKWVLDTACRQLQEWGARPETASLSMSVNISGRQFLDKDFVEQVRDAVAKYKIDAARLKLELTESVLVRDIDGAVARMMELCETGLTFSLDDFGTGYSSLSYLKRLPLSQLKIDQSFVRDIFVDPNDLAIVRAIVTLGESLGLAVIAEGVETEEQRAFLVKTGCLAFQGYYFGKPAPADALPL